MPVNGKSENPSAPHFIICGRCDAAWCCWMVPADQAEQELRAYLAADKDEQEDQ